MFFLILVGMMKENLEWNIQDEVLGGALYNNLS